MAPPFRNFTSGRQLSASHPMLDRSAKGAYCPTNKSMTSEIMKRTLRYEYYIDKFMVIFILNIKIAYLLIY